MKPVDILLTLGIAGLAYFVLTSGKRLLAGAGAASGLWQTPDGQLFVAYPHGTDTTGAPGTFAGTFPNPTDGKQYDLFSIPAGTGAPTTATPPADATTPPAAATTPPPADTTTPPAAAAPPPAAPDQTSIEDAVKQALKDKEAEDKKKAEKKQRDDLRQQARLDSEIQKQKIKDIQDQLNTPLTPPPPIIKSTPPAASGSDLIPLGDFSNLPGHTTGNVADVDNYSEHAYQIPSSYQAYSNLKRYRINIA